MEQPKTFEFYAPMSTFTKGKEHDGKNVIDVLVGGVISDDSIDEDGERLLQDGIDFDYFKSHGVIKAEHVKGMSNVIGYPLEIKRNGKRTEFVGRILVKAGTPQFKAGEEVVGLLENVTEWNRRNPNNQKSAGYSVEGSYGDVAIMGNHKDVRKSKVTNVVFTANPKNKQTFAVMYKSFYAGDSVNIGDMTGGGAGRIQSLEGSIKNIKSIGVSKMKFKDKEECKKFYISKGFSEDEAKKKADEFEEIKNGRETSDKKHSEKMEAIGKSLTSAQDMLKSFDAGITVKMTDSFNKAIQPGADNQIDAAPFLKAIGENQIEFLKSVTEQNKNNATILVNILGALKDSHEMNKGLTDEVRALEDNNADLVDFNTELISKLGKMDKSFTTEPGAGGAAAADPNDPMKVAPKYTQEEVSVALEKGMRTSKNEGEDTIDNWIGLIQAAEARGFDYRLLPPMAKAKVDSMMK